MLGGLLTTAGWRWTFLLPFPIAAVLAVVAARVLRPDPPRVSEGRFDIAGAVAVTGAMLALVFGISGAPDAGWTSAQTLVALAAAAALGAAFLAIELRVEHPLVRLGILRSPVIAGANLAGMTVFACYFGFQFMATLYMQQLLGWSALGTALAFLPAGLLVAFGAPRMGPLATRFGTATLITGRAALVRRRLRAVHPDRRVADVRDRDPAHDPAARARLRAHLPGGQHGRARAGSPTTSRGSPPAS